MQHSFLPHDFPAFLFKLGQHIKALFTKLLTIKFQHIQNNIVRYRVQLQFLIPGKHEEMIKQLIRHILDLLGLLAALMNIVIPCFITLINLHFKYIKIAKQGGQRCSQIMRHCGNKLVIRITGLLLLQHIVIQCITEMIQLPCQIR